MADIATQDDTEFDALHPNLKQLYTGGFDLNPKTVNMLNEGNAYKFDLWNTPPREIDPEIIPRKEHHAQSMGNALGYGAWGSWSGAMELLGSIPGGVDRFYDWSRTVLGKEPTEDSIFDDAENYFKSIAKSTEDNMNTRFAAPEGYAYKALAGFASAPIAIMSYIPAVRGLKALGTLGKVGKWAAKKSLPLGLAVTDVAREIDDGNAFELAKAAAYGYGTGVTIGFANDLSIAPRMAVLGAFGFLFAGTQANMDDRFAAATVWGALGYLGPKAGGLKVDLVQEAQSSKNYKKVMGDKTESELPDIQKVTEVRGEAANEFLELNIRYIENSQRLKEAKEAQKIVEENNKLVQEGKEPTEIPEALKEKGIISGTENFGGATATNGGLVFVAGTLDKLIRAFDDDTGKELWSYKLPYIGSAPPSSYKINDEQYIVIPASGGITLKNYYKDLVEQGDAIVAFKIKK